MTGPLNAMVQDESDGRTVENALHTGIEQRPTDSHFLGKIFHAEIRAIQVGFDKSSCPIGEDPILIIGQLLFWLDAGDIFVDREHVTQMNSHDFHLLVGREPDVFNLFLQMANIIGDVISKDQCRGEKHAVENPCPNSFIEIWSAVDGNGSLIVDPYAVAIGRLHGEPTCPGWQVGIIDLVFGGVMPFLVNALHTISVKD